MRGISAILLGAGESKRMGADKLSLPWGRRTILEQCFQTLLRSEVNELIIVLNSRNKAAQDLLRGRKASVVVNPLFKKGMSTSIRKGLQAIHSHCDGILVALGDQPLLKTRTINALIHAFNRGEGRIIIPSFRGTRGHPVIFHREFKRELLNLKGDVGGRSIFKSRSQDVRVIPVKSAGVIKDIDTWSAYEPPILAVRSGEGKSRSCKKA